MDNTPSSLQAYIRLLSQIADLLARNNCTLQSAMVEDLMKRLDAGAPLSVLRDSNDVFGGMGSITDCSLLSPWSGQSPDAARRDEKDFQFLIAELAERMCADGIASSRVKDIGAARAIWAGDMAKAQRIKPGAGQSSFSALSAAPRDPV